MKMNSCWISSLDVHQLNDEDDAQIVIVCRAARS
jgi:hypothetical protein